MSPSLGPEKQTIDVDPVDALDPKEAVPEGTGQNWLALVESIRRGERAGMEELYRVFSRGVRFFLCRQLGPQDLDDKVHDLFMVVTESIQRGELREPERLMGYVRTVLKRQIAGHIEEAVLTRRHQTELDSGSA